MSLNNHTRKFKIKKRSVIVHINISTRLLFSCFSERSSPQQSFPYIDDILSMQIKERCISNHKCIFKKKKISYESFFLETELCNIRLFSLLRPSNCSNRKISLKSEREQKSVYARPTKKRRFNL